MRHSSLVFAGLAFAAASCAPPPVNRASASPLSVAAIDIGRYAGLWYEIARFPNSFERECAGVTAQYTPRPDGKITVLNTCRQGGPAGEAKVAKGVARIVDPATNAKLKVSFFAPFEGDYWVLDRAADYSWSLVGEPRGRYLWILSRTPTLTDERRADLIGRLEALGYNVGALEWTRH